MDRGGRYTGYITAETLGDGLERVVADEAHEETRRRIRSGAAGAHLAAGFRGLGLGLLGAGLDRESHENIICLDEIITSV